MRAAARGRDARQAAPGRVGLCAGSFQSRRDIALIEPVASHLLSTASAVAGCGPAFAAMFLESLADGGVKNGLPRATAYRLAAQMMAGTAQLHLATGTHPGAMKDAVCSPGGTTIKGVAALEAAGLRNALITAVDATLQ